MSGPRALPTLLAVGILVGTGIVRDLWAGRAADPEALRLAGIRLSQVPAVIGPWHGTDVPLPPDALEVGGIAHYVSRSYSNAADGKHVVMTLVCGPAGPISLHPPTACYTGNGYALLRDPQAQSIESAAGTSHELMVAEFGPQGAAPGSGVRIYWGWGTAGRWSAPDSPRVRFAGEPVLYKLYVVQELDGAGSPPAAAEFLRDALAEIEGTLAPAPVSEEGQ